MDWAYQSSFTRYVFKETYCTTSFIFKVQFNAEREPGRGRDEKGYPTFANQLLKLNVLIDGVTFAKRATAPYTPHGFNGFPDSRTSALV